MAKTWEVIMDVTIANNYYVEAETEEEAQEKAKEMAYNDFRNPRTGWFVDSEVYDTYEYDEEEEA